MILCVCVSVCVCVCMSKHSMIVQVPNNHSLRLKTIVHITIFVFFSVLVYIHEEGPQGPKCCL